MWYRLLAVHSSDSESLAQLAETLKGAPIEIRCPAKDVEFDRETRGLILSFLEALDLSAQKAEQSSRDSYLD